MQANCSELIALSAGGTFSTLHGADGGLAPTENKNVLLSQGNRAIPPINFENLYSPQMVEMTNNKQ